MAGQHLNTRYKTQTYLKLHEKFREGNRHFVHELIHEFGHFRTAQTRLAEAKVERII